MVIVFPILHQASCNLINVMKTRLILKPGQRGTKKLVGIYGKQLVCVRYRYDEKTHKRFKTVEIIIDESDWQPPPEPYSPVFLKIKWEETHLREKVKAAGAYWQPELKLWETTYAKALALDLKERIVEPPNQ